MSGPVTPEIFKGLREAGALTRSGQRTRSLRRLIATTRKLLLVQQQQARARYENDTETDVLLAEPGAPFAFKDSMIH